VNQRLITPFGSALIHAFRISSPPSTTVAASDNNNGGDCHGSVDSKNTVTSVELQLPFGTLFCPLSRVVQWLLSSKSSKIITSTDTSSADTSAMALESISTHHHHNNNNNSVSTTQQESDNPCIVDDLEEVFDITTNFELKSKWQNMIGNQMRMSAADATMLYQLFSTYVPPTTTATAAGIRTTGDEESASFTSSSSIVKEENTSSTYSTTFIAGLGTDLTKNSVTGSSLSLKRKLHNNVPLSSESSVARSVHSPSKQLLSSSSSSPAFLSQEAVENNVKYEQDDVHKSSSSSNNNYNNKYNGGNIGTTTNHGGNNNMSLRKRNTGTAISMSGNGFENNGTSTALNASANNNSISTFIPTSTSSSFVDDHVNTLWYVIFFL
jgi:hypothetical protein